MEFFSDFNRLLINFYHLKALENKNFVNLNWQNLTFFIFSSNFLTFHNFFSKPPFFPDFCHFLKFFLTFPDFFWPCGNPDFIINKFSCSFQKIKLYLLFSTNITIIKALSKKTMDIFIWKSSLSATLDVGNSQPFFFYHIFL